MYGGSRNDINMFCLKVINHFGRNKYLKDDMTVDGYEVYGKPT